MAEGTNDAARTRLTRAIEECDRTGYVSGRVPLLLSLALVLERLGEIRAARATVTRVEAERFGNPRVIAAASTIARRMDLMAELIGSAQT